MKRRLSLLVAGIAFCLLFPYASNAQLVLNEVSQGTSGTKEYIELVVTGTRTCTDSTADIRGWIFDDNNGWLGAGTGQGIAQGCMRFANSPVWAAVPYGSVILIYNDIDKNSSITLPDDPSDANHDYVYVLPGSSSLLENNGSTPSSPSITNYVYPASGFSAGGSWTRIGLANGGDAVIITSPANPAAAYFSLGYGSLNNGGAATVYISSSGTGKCYYLSNNQYSTASSWVAGSAPGNETPGLPNSNANANWISSLRQFSGSTSVTRDTVTLSDCNQVVHGGVTYTSSVTLTDTLKAAGGCDSVYHVTVINIQSLTNITITPSGATTFCAGDSVVLQAPALLTQPNNALSFSGTGKYVNTSNNRPAFNDNFTFECWVNPVSTITIAPEATSGTQGVSGERYALYPTWGGSNNSITGPGNPDAGAGLSVGTNGIAVYEHGSAYLTPLLVWNQPVSGWTHIAVVYTNKQPSLYVNGALVRTGLTSLKSHVYPSLGQWAGNQYSLFGGIGGGNYGYFDGRIDEFRLWDISLSAADIAASYNRIIQPLPAAHLYAYYRFDEGAGSSTADLSGNNITGTLVSSPAWMVPSTAPISGYNGNGYTYSWAPGNETADSITVMASGIYTVTVTNPAGCTATASQTVTVITPVAKDTSLNSCSSVFYNGTTYTSSVILKDTLKSSYGCDSVYHTANISIEPITPAVQNVDLHGCDNVMYNGTTYNSSIQLQDTVKSVGGCDSVWITANLTVNEASTINVTDSFYEGQSYTLPSGITVNTPGVYHSTLQNISGCDSTINTTLIQMKADCIVKPPIAFTPNNDGFNDVWKVFKEDCVKKCRVNVYNRYGSRVYYSENYSNDWNGTYKNNPLPDATYYYVIDVTHYDGRIQSLRGDVTILR